jgi:hypothetical protein
LAARGSTLKRVDVRVRPRRPMPHAVAALRADLAEDLAAEAVGPAGADGPPAAVEQDDAVAPVGPDDVGLAHAAPGGDRADAADGRRAGR